MKQEDFDFIKDAFSQILDDIAGNPDWNDAASAISADLGALERELEGKVVSPDKSLEEEMEKFGECWPYPASFDGYDKDWVDELTEECAKHFYELGQSQMPMPEDTVLFNKGVAEGRRLEREDMMKDISNILAPDDPATNEEIKKMLQERRAMIEKEVQRRVFNEVEHCWEEAHHEGYIEGWNECDAAYKSK